MNLIIHTDGGARGNPGPAAVGVVIEKIGGSAGAPTRTTLAAFGKKIGKATNNVAEYQGVVAALTHLTKTKGIGNIQVVLDSRLVANQLAGTFKVKDATLRMLLLQIRGLEAELGAQVSYITVPREQNFRADALVNRALDS